MDATDMREELRDYIAKSATSWEHFLALAEETDPALKASVTEKTLIGSKSVWAPLATWAITATAAYYGLNLDPATCTTLASLLAYIIVVLMRYVTRSPIGGVFRVPPEVTAPASPPS